MLLKMNLLIVLKKSNFMLEYILEYNLFFFLNRKYFILNNNKFKNFKFF
jgi:hypothetical protein